jgi:exopolyphosphatase/guanosine-5'-triphosphate,3'-diphosphate pyrophosphatase
VRLGVLDVGSNSVHLEVIDGHHSGRPQPYKSFKHDIKLTQYLDNAGHISEYGINTLIETIRDSTAEAEKLQLDELLAFATSAIREAGNCEEVIKRVLQGTGIDLQVLTGDEEAQFTFLAARRWFGWSAGDLLVFDIGGGSLEIARGTEEAASFTTSIMLGAGRLTRKFLEGDPFTEKSLRKLEEFIIDSLKPLREPLSDYKKGVAVGTSKTFRTLDKLCTEFQSKKLFGITRDSINALAIGISKMSLKERRNLPGVSETRAHQIVAGALVARQVMMQFDIEMIQTCPWALREGIVLRRMDWLS